MALNFETDSGSGTPIARRRGSGRTRHCFGRWWFGSIKDIGGTTPARRDCEAEGHAGADAMNIALFYESVVPARGGCETYIVDLARRMAADGHEVHLYASCWDTATVPTNIQVHFVRSFRGPRFL